jgi:hypothetical protein
VIGASTAILGQFRDIFATLPHELRPWAAIFNLRQACFVLRDSRFFAAKQAFSNVFRACGG